MTHPPKRRKRIAAGLALVVLLAAAGAFGLLRARSHVPEIGACQNVATPPVPAASSTPQQPRPAGVPEAAQQAVVQRVIDGDGICVGVESPVGPLKPGRTYEIRLVGINAPGKGQCWSSEATSFVRRQIGEGRIVYLLPDEQSTDRYGRFLRYLWNARGELFNEKAVRQGYAREIVKAPNALYAERLRNAEAQARKAGRGLWGACLLGKLLRRLPLDRLLSAAPDVAVAPILPRLWRVQGGKSYPCCCPQRFCIEESLRATGR